MKKLLALALTLVLACSLAVPALAADSADQRLTAVTASVKETLDLNTDAYTSFYGDLDDNSLAPTWLLNWEKDDGYLSITATEEGKVLTYNKMDFNDPSSGSGQFAPTFPTGDRQRAKAAALAFLDKVLTGEESAKLEETNAPERLWTSAYSFGGEVLLNGLSAGLSFRVTVRCADNEVTGFYRDDYASDLSGLLTGGVPAPGASVPADQAAAALRDTLSLRLEYVLPEGEGTQAVLRWLPDAGDDYYVDAGSGALVDLSELYRQLAEGGRGMNGGLGSADSNTESGAPAEAPSGGLSPAEQEGVAKLEGVLDQKALDAALRKTAALGLDKYALASASYYVDREAGEDGVTAVTASLRYRRQVGDYTWQRTATVDARTGELISLYSTGRLPEDGELSVDFDQARTRAEAFLTGIAPGQFARTALYDSGEAEEGWIHAHSFTYAQQENGYFYAGNSISVSVDATDGSISSYGKYFDDSVTFDSADGVCTADEAVDAWLATYEAELQYILTPVPLTLPAQQALADLGAPCAFRLVLGYALERDRDPLGIAAKTVQPVYREDSAVQSGLTYGDIDGHWAQAQIERLARYSVGYAGGSFQPGKALTQLDLVALLVSTDGYVYEPDQEDAADTLYDRAYSLGILKRGERDDGALMTRAQTVKLILDAAGYGAVARLEGIYRTAFADDGEIPAGYYGYAALAQGLGIVSGAPGSLFLPNATATRAEAAVMLYNLMDR